MLLVAHNYHIIVFTHFGRILTENSHSRHYSAIFKNGAVKSSCSLVHRATYELSTRSIVPDDVSVEELIPWSRLKNGE